MVNRTSLVSLFAFFLASTAYADPDSGVSAKEAPRDRVVAVANGGLGFMQRQATTDATSGGFTWGGDIFGPELHVIDVDYTWQYNTQRDLKKLTGSFGVVLGPSVGFVNYLGNNPEQHVSFGGRAGAFADLDIWNFALGVDGSYRFGYASGYGAEGFGTLGVHMGLTFDVARR